MRHYRRGNTQQQFDKFNNVPGLETHEVLYLFQTHLSQRQVA